MKTDNRSHRPQSWEHLLERDREPQTGFRIGIAAACVIHAVIFAITWPTIAQAPPEEPEHDGIRLVLTNVRYPEPPPPEPVIVEEIVRHEGPPIIPGPPEEIAADPIVHEAPPTVKGPVIEAVEIPVYIPEAPPAQPKVVTAGQEVHPPKKVYQVEPRYTEAARQVRIQGFVTLDLVIDTEGRVESVKVLRGLPLGLTKSAVDAARQWRFAPSTYLGRPVAVRYILTVRFSLQ